MSEQEIDLNERFPDMEPVTGAPSLWTVNGCGLTIWGSRDADRETGTYVATHCLVLLFIPVLCLKAYRVMRPSDDGWYFLGRVPLSGLAWTWNTLVIGGVCAGLAAGAWSRHTGTPDYIADQQMKEASGLADSNQWLDAARVYRDVADGPSSRTDDAVQAFEELITTSLATASATEAVEALNLTDQVARHAEPEFGFRIFRNAGTELLETLSASDPKTALPVLDALTKLVAAREPGAPSDDQAESTIRDARRGALESLLQQSPGEPQLAAELAGILEQEGDFDRCEQLLTPLQDSLGLTEGARILGQILSRKGEFDDAQALLKPYIDAKLTALHATENRYENFVEQVQNMALHDLQQGNAPESFYAEYEHAGEAQQQELVSAYIMDRLQSDQQYAELQQQMMEHSAVVSVALDLGVVQLRRAQAMESPDDRTAELEDAEKTFLAIRSFAGESDEYRLFLGQVYFWLGKQDEGHSLFDELIGSESRTPGLLVQISSALRTVGEETQARKVAEQAWAEATDDETKYAAAEMRALLQIDADDEITWLKRANTRDPSVRTQLGWAQGNKAAGEGRTDDAIRFYRSFVREMQDLPESAARLNNSALGWFALARLTGQASNFDNGLRQMEKAIALEPDSALLLLNSGSTLLEHAVRDIVRDRIDLSSLRMSVDLGLLSYLYNTTAERDQLIADLRSHAALQHAIEYLERAVVLSPNRASTYGTLVEIYYFLNDHDALRRINTQLDNVELDLEEHRRQVLDMVNGTADERIRSFTESRLQHNQAVADRRRGQPDVTFAIATAQSYGDHLSLWMVGDPPDADAIVRDCEQAATAAPSASARAVLYAALQYRACRTLASEVTGFAEIESEYRRTLSCDQMLAVGVLQIPEAREQILGDPDVQRSLTVFAELRSEFPEFVSASLWPLYDAAGHDEASAIVQVLKADTPHRLTAELNRRLGPFSPSRCVSQYLGGLATGDPSAGQEAIRRCLDAGISVPFGDQ